MNTQEFSQKIKAKYPQYRNVDDTTLVTKIIEKYPAYQSQITDLQVNSDGGIVSDITESAQERIGNVEEINNLRDQGQSVASEVVNAVAPKIGNKVSPILEKLQRARSSIVGEAVIPRTDVAKLGQTAGLVNDILGAGLSAITPKAVKKFGQEKAAQIAQTEFGKLGINTIEQYNQWAEKNPLTAKNLEGAVNIATLIPEGKVGEVVASGVTKAGKGVAKGAKGALGGAVDGAADSVGAPIKAVLKDTIDPEKIMQRVARIPKSKQVAFEKMTGESVGKYLTDRGIYGNDEEILTQLYNRFNESKNTADDAFKQLTGTYKPKSLGTAINTILKREVAVSSPGAMSRDLKRVMQLKKKFSSTGLDMSESNEIKRMLERNKIDYLKQNLPTEAEKIKNLDDAVRNWQATEAEKQGLENLKQINKETQAARQLLDDLGREAAGQAGNNALSLTDAVLVAGGDPTAIGMLISKKILGSKKAQSFIAKRLAGPTKIPKVKAKFGKPKPGLEEFLKKQK